MLFAKADHNESILNFLAMRYIKPLYIKEINTTKHVGSCFFIKISDKTFIVTAAHLSDNKNRHNTLIIGAATGEFSLNLEPIFVTNKPNNSRHHDKFDFAIYFINDISVLGDLGFVTKEEIYSQASFRENEFFAFGFPVSKNKKLNTNPAKSAKTTINAVQIKKKTSPIKSKLNELNYFHSDNTFFDYSTKRKVENTSAEFGVNPQGWSGGLVILIEAIDDYFYEVTFDSMIIEFYDDCDMLVGLKLKPIFEAANEWISKNQENKQTN